MIVHCVVPHLISEISNEQFCLLFLKSNKSGKSGHPSLILYYFYITFLLVAIAPLQ